MDYLERAYHDPWDFSFSGEPFTPHPAETRAAPAPTPAPASTTRKGTGRPSVSTGLAAVVAVGVTMVVTDYVMSGFTKWSLARMARRAQKRREDEQQRRSRGDA
ncbi:hypothetical protein AB4Y45_32485 [Paraburkholderia sp. EG287A]|uniref:hypothetical protein n=1 Tax=Paraburkholderia sp. EG287A TaxID=3237012 RepID=UPI0034D19310